MLNFSYVAEHVERRHGGGGAGAAAAIGPGRQGRGQSPWRLGPPPRLAERRSLRGLAEPWAVPRHRQRPPIPRLRVGHGVPAAGSGALAQQGRERLGIRPGHSRRSEEVRSEAIRQGAEAGRRNAGRRTRSHAADLLAQLARFELSPPQVERVANPDKRSECGISAHRRTRSSPIPTCSPRWTKATASPT